MSKMSKHRVFKWFKDRRELGDQSWYCMSSVVKLMGCNEQTGGSSSIRRAIRSLRDDYILDEQRIGVWQRYFRLNDKYLDNFKQMLK